MALTIKTVPNVEILHAGIEYALSTGPATFTPEDLQDVVMAANEDGSIPDPRIKIGHIDPRYNDETVFDGSPCFGKATNLRLSENGMAVYADIVGVPGWLADIMPYAFPSRSIEGFWGVESQMGKNWRFVLSALSVLGVLWPGVTVLEDLPQYWGDEVPPGVEIDLEVVAASKQPGGGPMGVAASANLDDIRRAFYNDYVPDHGTEGSLWWWIQAVYTDPNELVVEDDEDGQLYKLTFSSDADGNVSFGEPEPVRIDYIPDTREAKKAAATYIAAALGVGRTCLASYPTRAASRPESTGGAMDPKQIRERLGLPEDATDEQVQTAYAELGSALGQPPEATPVVDPNAVVIETGTGQPTPGANEGNNEGNAPEGGGAAPAAQAAFTPPPGTVLVDAAQWETVKAGAMTAIDLKKTGDKSARETAVAAAVADGRIPPARKEHWLKLIEADSGALATLDALEKNTIPVDERGHGQDLQDGTAPEAEVVKTWTRDLFHETRSLDEGAQAGGAPARRSRISSDAHYSRR